MHYVVLILLVAVLALTPSCSSNILETLNGACEDAMTKGDYPTAEKVCKQAVAEAETRAQNKPVHALALHDLAAFYSGQGQYAQAELLYKRAWRSESRHSGQGYRRSCYPPQFGCALQRPRPIRAGRTPLQTVLGDPRADTRAEGYQLAATLHSLAEFYRTKGQYAQVDPLLNEPWRSRSSARAEGCQRSRYPP